MDAVIEMRQKAKLPEGSLLDPVHHARLIVDLPDIARTAGIPTHMIHRSMTEYLSEPELEWFVNIRENAQKWAGVCFIGSHVPSVETKMMAICAALLRNFIDARLMTMATIIAAAEEGDMPEPRVLLVPNFSVDIEGGKPYTAWQMGLVHGVLVDRMSQSLVTVLYASSLVSLRKHFGDELEKFIREHWLVMK